MMRFILCCLLLGLSTGTTANLYSIPQDGSRLVGEIQHHTVVQGDHFQTIAKQYNVGILALMEANPGVDPFLPTVGSQLLIPTQMLLPDLPHKGIVINLPELRLYYFPKGGKEVYVFPVGIGRVGRATPEMQTQIRSRIPNPSWTPPASLRAEYLAKGETLPPVVPPGPDNPLGDYAMQLSYGDGSYLIHGTNKDFGIGMRVSAGCIRLNPDDIEWLFYQVKAGEGVRVIDQTVKYSSEPDGRQILEVHSALSKSESDFDKDKLVLLNQDIVKFIGQQQVDNYIANDVLLNQTGMPVDIQRKQPIQGESSYSTLAY